MPQIREMYLYDEKYADFDENESDYRSKKYYYENADKKVVFYNIQCYQCWCDCCSWCDNCNYNKLNKMKTGNDQLLYILNKCYLPNYMQEIMILIKKGVDVNIISKDGQTLLSRLCKLGHQKKKHSKLQKLINLCISAGANVNLPDQNGNTPLINAIELAHANNINIVNILINAGADVNIKNRYNHNILMVIFHKYNLNHKWHDLIMDIIDLTNDVTDRCGKGYTAFDYYSKYQQDKYILSDKELAILKGELKQHSMKSARKV